MSLIDKKNISTGITWIGIPEAELFICCGCPADTVKHLKRAGLIQKVKTDRGVFETGPNALLLSDALLQNGQVANLSEFPVMQMLYSQGMNIPTHENYSTAKPILIGLEEHINSQIQYIYRGNYGLISKEEILNTGTSAKMAEKIYAIKKFFSHGKISSPEDLFSKCIVKNAPIEIKNGVFIERLSFNKYKIRYKDESEIVDLNLGTFENYEPPFDLPFVDIPRHYFTIIHSGEGNGWDIDRPCMASIIVFDDKIYIIDAGPNILNNLVHLGISAYEVEGIFLTHIHDDHFAGLTELIKTDKRFKFYTSAIVRETAQKKLAALMNVSEKAFHYVFDCEDLVLDQWNDVGGLQVKPIFSPHPVETNAFFFKMDAGRNEKTFAHIADVITIGEFEKIIAQSGSEIFDPGEAEQLKNSYTSYADLKKVDVGGGAIHGSIGDFDGDTSAKILLSHTEFPEDIPEAKRSQTTGFGEADVLIKDGSSFYASKAIAYLRNYFNETPSDQLRPFLDLPVIKFAPGETILKKLQDSKVLCLVLSGIVESITSAGIKEQSHAGTFVSNSDVYFKWPMPEEYKALSFAHVLHIEEAWMNKYIQTLQLSTKLDIRLQEVSFLLKTPLIGNTVSFVVLNAIRSSMIRSQISENMNWKVNELTDLYIIEEGEALITYKGKEVLILQKNDHFGGVLNIQPNRRNYDVLLKKGSVVYKIPESTMLSVPNVLWKVLEANEKRSLLCVLSK